MRKTPKKDPPEEPPEEPIEVTIGRVECEQCDWTVEGEDVGLDAWDHKKETGHSVELVDTWEETIEP